jgi:hypothetical protein
MDVEIRKNGVLEIRLTATDAIDRVALDTFEAQAQLGRKVLLTAEDGVAVIRMEEK